MNIRRKRRRVPPTIQLPAYHRRHPGTIWLALIIVALVLLRQVEPSQPVRPNADDDMQRLHQGVFDVTRVVDGDTINIDVPDGKFDTTRIRLWGVDTPEVAGSPTGDMFWGEQASRFAKSTLEGRQVRLELIAGATRDKYRRLLAYVFVEPSGQLFNEMLIRQGHGYADTRFQHPMKARFRELEDAARAGRVGLWREVTVRDMPGWRQKLEKPR